jgi:hypothetical protein
MSANPETGKTREERIREYAYTWYQFRCANGVKGTPEGDWAKAEHIVNSEDNLTSDGGTMSYHEGKEYIKGVGY